MGLLLDNGAIADLMRQMTGGGGTATLLGSPVNGPDVGAPGGAPSLPPQMAAMGAGPGAPTMGAPTAPGAPPGGPMPTSLPAGPGLLDRLGAGIRHAVGGDVAPAGLEGLISPDDLNRAKTSLPGTLWNLLGGTMPAQRTAEKLSDMIANRQAVSGIMQQRQQQADFNAIRQKYAAPLDAAKTVQDKFDVLTSMAGDLMRIGHPEGAKMAGVLKDLRPNDRTKVVGNTLVGPDGTPLFTDTPVPKTPTPMIKEFADGIKVSQDGGSTWHKVGDAPAGAVRNIDPLSPEGVRAQLEIAAAKANGKGAVAALPAPIAAKVGQAGEMLKKSYDLLPAMDALPVSLAGSAAQDVATHGLGVGGLRIPGTKGVGSMALNREPSYARYQAALSPFILAAAHALSGARINQDQVQQIRESIELKPGDWSNPSVMAQKKKNIIDLINSISGSLPAGAMASQEGQMGDGAIGVLRGYGYLPVTGAEKGAAPNAPAAGGEKIITVNGKKFRIKVP